MSQKSVLVIDDEDLLLTIYRSFLELGGYQVYGATNGNEALAFFKKHHIDFVVTDYTMPRENGFEILKKIHALGHRPKSFIVSGNIEITGKIKEKDGDGIVTQVLEKPVDYDLLISLLT